MKKILLFLSFFFFFQVSLANLSPFTILDDISLDQTYSDTISFQFDPLVYDARTFFYAFRGSGLSSCEPQEGITTFYNFPLFSTTVSKLNISQDPTSPSINGLQICLRVKKLSETTVPYEYYLFSNNALQIINPPSDLTPPILQSFQIENPLNVYKKDDNVSFVGIFDDTLLPNSPSVIFATLSNNVTVVLNQISGQSLRGTYTVGQNPGEETSDLTLKDITGKVINVARTEQNSSFSTQNKLLSSSGKIKIVSSNTSPLDINFIDQVEFTAQGIDYIQVQVRNEVSENLSLKYGFSSDSSCNSSDTFNDTFQLGKSIIIDDTSKNGKYICFEIARVGDVKSYLGSTYPINIVLSSTTSTLPVPIIIPVLTGSTQPYTYTGTSTAPPVPVFNSTGSTNQSPVVIGSTMTGTIQTSTGVYIPATSPLTGFSGSFPPQASQTVSGTTLPVTSSPNFPGENVGEVSGEDSPLQTLSPRDTSTVSFQNGEIPFLPNNSSLPDIKSPNIFSDIEGNFAQTYIELLVDKGVISTNNDSFNPDSPITRAEFLKLLLKSNGIAYEEQNIGTSIFSDIVENNWQSSVALKSYALGVTNGYEDNTFRPDGEITRIEAIKFMTKVKGYPLTDSLGTSFIDLSNSWMKKYANKAKEIGLINGQKSSFGYLFNPNSPITRAESAKIIAKSLEK